MAYFDTASDLPGSEQVHLEDVTVLIVLLRDCTGARLGRGASKGPSPVLGIKQWQTPPKQAAETGVLPCRC